MLDRLMAWADAEEVGHVAYAARWFVVSSLILLGFFGALAGVVALVVLAVSGYFGHFVQHWLWLLTPPAICLIGFPFFLLYRVLVSRERYTYGESGGEPIDNLQALIGYLVICAAVAGVLVFAH